MRGTTVSLVRGDQQAQARTWGGVLSSYQVGGLPVVAGEEDPARFSFRGSLLAPWPNRVAGSRWSWAGEELSLPVNEQAVGAALHGLVYDVEWTVVEQAGDRVVLAYRLEPQPGYPFPLELEVSYALEDSGLVCALTAGNVGPRPAPVGLGVHPYVDARGRVEDLEVTIPAATLLLTDQAWRQAGRVPVGDLDFRGGRRLGGLELDAAFTDLAFAGGRTACVVRWPDGREVVVWSGETCRWWLMYTSHSLAPSQLRRSVAIEPMTCPPDAFNTGEVDVLPPGGALTLTWGMTVR